MTFPIGSHVYVYHLGRLATIRGEILNNSQPCYALELDELWGKSTLLPVTADCLIEAPERPVCQFMLGGGEA